MQYFLEISTKRIFITNGAEYSILINYINTEHFQYINNCYDFDEDYNIKLNAKVALKLRRLLS